MANPGKKPKNKENTPIKKPSTKKNSPLKKIDEEKVEVKPEIIKTKPYAKTESNAGARSKLELHQEEIINRTKAGSSKKDRVAGLICDKTYNEWINSGDSDLEQEIISQYSQFCMKIREAENEFRETLRVSIKTHAADDWKAAAWLLERSDPESYKLKDKVDMTSNGHTLNGHIILMREDEPLDEPEED